MLREQTTTDSVTGVTVCVISGFRHEVDEICALVGSCVAPSGSSIPTFRDKLSVPSSRRFCLNLFTLKIVPKDFPETSVLNYYLPYVTSHKSADRKKNMVQIELVLN